MTFQAYNFVPVMDETDPLTVSISLAGGSGTGKTYSALRLARGLAGGKPFGFIDTENGRARHYRGDFPEMRRLDFTAFENGEKVGFPPERWIAAIDAAEKAGLPVLVLDSFSHAWSGIGGVLELQQAVLERMGGSDSASLRAWAEVKPRYRRLIDRIIRARCHIVICQRAKPLIKDGKGKLLTKSKIRRPDLDWDIVGDAELVFEMTAAFIMDPTHPGVPIVIKCADAFKPIFARGTPITEASGQAMAKWAQGEDQGGDAKRLLDEARGFARKGTEAFRAWFKMLDADRRETVRTIVPECQKLAADADAAGKDDPFTAALDPEETERIAREAFERSNADAAALTGK